MLKPAIDVANGKMVFRDTFSQYGALTVLIQALTIKLFGEYLIVIRLLTALLYGGISVLLWLIFSRILSMFFTSLSYVIWFLLAYFWFDHPAMFILPWATVFSVFSILLSIYLLILFLEKQKYYLLFMVGMTSSMSFWFKINYGIISLFFMFLLLIILHIFSGKKKLLSVLLAFLFGCCIVNGAFFTWLTINDALNDFILQSIKFAFAFSANNKFSSNDCFVIKLFKCLFQIGSVHGGTTVVWTILPCVSMVVLLYSGIVFFAKNKTLLLTDKIVFSVSFISAGLWLGYYPINALFHMFLSSVLFVGLLIWLLCKIIENLHIRYKAVIVVLIVLSIVGNDIAFKIANGTQKIRRIISYEKIETPKFLSGMYVSKDDKQVYLEIAQLIDSYSDCGLINITNNGLYSLYKRNNAEFHKMYAYRGWDNCYLYPDYIPKLAKQLSMKSDIVLSSRSIMIDGYVPVMVFQALNGGRAMDFSEETILLVPAKEKEVFDIACVDVAAKLNSGYSNFFHIKLNLKSNESIITINSIVAKVFTEHNIPKFIGSYELDYSIMPCIFDKDSQQFIRKLYSFDKQMNQYSILKIQDEIIRSKLMNIFSNIFLYETYFDIADTFGMSMNNKIDVYLNGLFTRYGEKGMPDVKYSNGDVLELVVPISQVSQKYVIKLRVNYNNNCYDEKKISTLNF